MQKKMRRPTPIVPINYFQQNVAEVILSSIFSLSNQKYSWKLRKDGWYKETKDKKRSPPKQKKTAGKKKQKLHLTDHYYPNKIRGKKNRTKNSFYWVQTTTTKRKPNDTSSPKKFSKSADLPSTLLAYLSNQITPSTTQYSPPLRALEFGFEQKPPKSRTQLT